MFSEVASTKLRIIGEGFAIFTILNSPPVRDLFYEVLSEGAIDFYDFWLFKGGVGDFRDFVDFWRDFSETLDLIPWGVLTY